MNYFIIIDAVTLILGIYIIFVSLRMKKSGKIESTFVAEDEMKKIKDTAGYIAYIYPKSLVFGIVIFVKMCIRDSPIIECPEAAKAINAGDEVTVDFDSGIITDETTGEKFKGQAFPPFMQKIIDCEGLVNYINQK